MPTASRDVPHRRNVFLQQPATGHWLSVWVAANGPTARLSSTFFKSSNAFSCRGTFQCLEEYSSRLLSEASARDPQRSTSTESENGRRVTNNRTSFQSKERDVGLQRLSKSQVRDVGEIEKKRENLVDHIGREKCTRIANMRMTSGSESQQQS